MGPAMADRGQGPAATPGERVQARVNVAAIERNCSTLRAGLAPGAQLCAVVKANGYGHGAAESARAALAGGASWLAVVSAAELRELRSAGLERVPILVMGALTMAELAETVALGGEVVVWSERYLEAVAASGGGRVHVKLDSGMGRLGTRDPEQATRVARAAGAAQEIALVGLMTHFATADELDDGGFFEAQLGAFVAWTRTVLAEQPGLLVHAANSAATLRDSAAQFDMVRCGIAVYGMDPFGSDPAARSLQPALSLHSYVAEVKPFGAGDSAGYGRRFVADRDTYVGLLPVGYGDGWRRSLSNNAEVLIAGRRYPLVGTVSMDSFTVDLGPDGGDLLGESAVLVGSQDGELITAEEIARRLETINYEVTCALTPRVTRIYHRDDPGPPAAAVGGRATAEAPS
jgi:alanine racemase